MVLNERAEDLSRRLVPCTDSETQRQDVLLVGEGFGYQAIVG